MAVAPGARAPRRLDEVLPPVTFAADLVPWWFAAGFWLALVVLVAMVVRDVRRMGGPRRLLRGVREAIDRFGEDEVRDGDRADPDR